MSYQSIQIVKLIFLLIFSNFLFGIECETEYSKYPILKQDGWSVRVDEQINLYGCKVVPLYNFLIKNDAIDVMDAMDENPKITKEILKLFKRKEMLKLLIKNESVKEVFLLNANNLQFLQNLNYLLKKYYNSAIRKKINYNPVWLNLYIFPALQAKNIEELKRHYIDLRRFNIKELELLSFIYSILGDLYKFDELLKYFKTLKNKLSKHQLEQLISYPAYISYFFCPSKEEMNIYGNNDDYILQKQKQFQSLMIDIYKTIYKHHRKIIGNEQANIIALRTIEQIFPYIVSQTQNYTKIKELFSLLIEQGFIANLWKQIGNVCNKQKANELFAMFGDDNIDNLLKLKQNENDLYKYLIYNLHLKMLQMPLYVANVYAKFTYRQWEIFKDLLYSMPIKELNIRVAVLKELDDIGYFKNIVNQNDYMEFVEKDSDVNRGFSAKKYKFILFTSYPSDSDPSVIDLIIAGHKIQAKENLEKLYNISISELETHDFTTFEQGMAIASVVDWTMTIASVVAAPFTGGASLSYIELKTAAKQGAKYFTKRSISYVSKRLANKFIRYARIGRKKLFDTFGEKNGKKFGKVLNKLDNQKDNFMIGTTVSSTIMGYFIMPQNLEAKSICEGE